MSRLVVLPDYQGIGIGSVLLQAVGELYLKQNYRFTITTSHPALNRSLAKNNKWKVVRQGRVSKLGKTANMNFKQTLSRNRLTCSWELKQL